MSKTLEEEQAALREAFRDFAYLLLKPIMALAERLGMTPRPWVRERQIRERWQPPSDTSG